jgi:N-glycosylase/DNA lyase
MNKITKELPKELQETYNKVHEIVVERLNDFIEINANSNEESIFYEFCFCILTPQSSAKNAIEVQKKLIKKDFLNAKFNPVYLLAHKPHYIRFHNIKSERLLNAIDFFPKLLEILSSNLNQYEKRKLIKDNFSGIGMKESSHFLRNIGYKNLAIIDRHILRNLEFCGVLETSDSPKNEKQYLEIEQKFLDYSAQVGIEIDILDLVFFAHSNGSVLK